MSDQTVATLVVQDSWRDSSTPMAPLNGDLFSYSEEDILGSYRRLRASSRNSNEDTSVLNYKPSIDDQPSSGDSNGQQVGTLPRTIVGQWEGSIESLDHEHQTFTARLADLVGRRPDEIASFGFEEVGESDIDQLNIGSLFFWTIVRVGARRRPHTESDIRFRRFPKITTGEQELLKTAASEALDLFV